MKQLSRHIVALLLLLGAHLPAWAQVPPDSATQSDMILDQVIEDAVTDIETDDQTDWTVFTDRLADLKEHPLNLNSARKEDLLILPGMNEILANSLLDYIHRFGNLSSIYELQAVPGFDYALFQKIRPFIVVREIGAKDISPGTKHPMGPGFKEIMSGADHEIMLRFITLLEEQEGYTPPEDSNDTRYRGNPYKYYARYRMRYGQNFSAALVAEKDQGEAFEWAPETNTYGFDFLAGHVFLRDYGKLKRLVVGDYNIQSGQGLLLSTGLGFGKGSETVNSAKRQDLGIRPYASVNENQFMRGAAAEVAFGDVYITGFFSRMSLDANVETLSDTLQDDLEVVNSVSTLQTSGLHRTPSELADKDAITETDFGGRIAYKKRWLSLGATHYFQQYGNPIQPSDKDYKLYDFTGDLNYLTGLDFDITYRNFNFFGEIGRSRSGGTGTIAGFLTSLHPKVDFTLVGRNFEKDFHTSRGFAFAERPTVIQNERGMYMGLKIYPNTRWTLSTYYDQFSFPWHKFNTSYPSRGHEFMAQAQYKPNRSLLIYLRWRSDHKEINSSDLPEGQQLETLVPTARQALRLHFQYKVHRTLSIRSRAEHSWFMKGYSSNPEEKHTGFLLYQDIDWRLGWKWRLVGRYAIFNAEDYDARIYAYENDVLGFFSVPGYAGVGTRYYLILNYKPVRGLEFWLRFARTDFQWDKTIGSGLQEINGNRRSEVKLQVRYKF